MAAFYRVQIALETPFSTPFHSGTLFGHLCWAWRHLKDEQWLERWLKKLRDREEEPVLVSDGLPHGYLPVPILSPAPEDPAIREEQRNQQWLPRLERVKKLRKTSWIPLDTFLTLRDKLSEPALWEALGSHDEGTPRERSAPDAAARRKPFAPLEHRVAHNTINRLTGTTPKTGGLYFMDEYWPGSSPPQEPWHLDVWVQCPWSQDELRELFAWIGQHGYGRDASLGRGRFRAEVKPAPDGLFDHPGTRRLSLSHGSLTQNMKQPRYRLETHYGKLGSWFASGTLRPFKYPLLLARPGATFEPADDGPYGELLTGIHPEDDRIVHNAWHLTVPFTEVL